MYRANIFHVSFSDDLLCWLSYFISLLAIVSILYLSVSKYLLVWIEFRLEILCVGTVEEAIERLYFSCCLSLLAFLLLLHMCTVPPPTLIVGRVLLGTTIHPSE